MLRIESALIGMRKMYCQGWHSSPHPQIPWLKKILHVISLSSTPTSGKHFLYLKEIYVFYTFLYIFYIISMYVRK